MGGFFTERTDMAAIEKRKGNEDQALGYFTRAF